MCDLTAHTLHHFVKIIFCSPNYHQRFLQTVGDLTTIKELVADFNKFRSEVKDSLAALSADNVEMKEQMCFAIDLLL